MLHIAIIIIATFLLSVSVISYLRIRRRKLLILSGALCTFTVKELILFSDVVLYTSYDVIIPVVVAPITHILNFFILSLIFVGIFWD